MDYTSVKEDITTEEFWVNMGPQHPSTHGVLRLELKLSGETVVDSVVHIGYLHRSIEKIAEKRTYTQFIPFTDRLDYLASMNNNLAYVLAAEKLMGIEANDRAKHIRVIMAEFNRIASHLFGVTTFTQDLGAFATPLFYGMREREKIVEFFDSVCGQRLTYNYMRIGGVSRDLPAGSEDKKKNRRIFAPEIRRPRGDVQREQDIHRQDQGHWHVDGRKGGQLRRDRAEPARFRGQMGPAQG